MRKQIIHRFLVVLGLGVIAVLFSMPPSMLGENALSEKLSEFRLTLGLDLAGGTELDYQVDLSDAKAQNADDDPLNDVSLESIAESVRDALERRVNPAGVGEIVVKRSQVDEQEHILIQMPPSSNVAKAKADAQRDNRLEFFEEDPTKTQAARLRIASELTKITPANWNQKVVELTQDPVVLHEEVPAQFQGDMQDQALAQKLAELSSGQILQEIVETQTELRYTMGEDGNLQVEALPKPVFGIVRLTEKSTENREKTIEAKAKARHILFGYPGALRAGEDLPYASAEEAQAKAQEILDRLKTEGTDGFYDLAKEYSTEPAAQRSYGELGEFAPGTMAQEFNDAVFGADGPGLLPELVETDFGYHIIDVQELQPETTQTTSELKLAYALIGWDKSEIGWVATELGGAQLENAVVGYDQIGTPEVDLLFNDEGADLFAEITGRVASRTCEGGPCRLGIKVGGQWITQPTVREKILGRTSRITGNFTYDSAKDLADGLNLGAIDAPVVLSGQLTIQPELGASQLTRSLKAAAYGILGIMLFLTLSYRLMGLVAAFSLALYASLFVTVMKVWPESFGGPIVLSLAGAAGIALSIGLAVDGNILIFERFKEEIGRGRGVRKAIDLGFERAWTAIRDSNLTTLLTCIILFNFGNAMMRGFAITLIVGTILSMFTAIIISRNVLRFLLLFESTHKSWLFGITKTMKTSPSGAKIRKRS